jgi:hypothetical protein
VSFTAITLCVASERVFVVVVYFVIDLVLKLLDTPRTLAAVLGWGSYKSVSKSFRIGRLERELQMVQLSSTRCSSISIL